MLRRTLSRALRLGLLAGLVGGAVKLVRQRRPSNPRAAGSDPHSQSPPPGAVTGDEAPPAPEQALVEPTMLQDVVDRKTADDEATAGPSTGAAWVEPDGDACPAGYPVKAKESSKIFHLPGMINYDRTTPDRCYRDEAAAESDGYRPAKR